MKPPFPYELLEDPEVLARFEGWDVEVYRDFLALQRGEQSEADFRAKYETTAAILILDMTAFTESAMHDGEVFSLLRIMDVQKVCAPVFLHYQPRRVRSFADDFYAIFDDPHTALDAALEVHRRVRAFNASALALHHRAETCIGLGYGRVLQIGPDRAMGDEMNRASKLGEDTACANETLLTENFYRQVARRSDCRFERRVHASPPFPFYAAWEAAEESGSESSAG